MSHPLTPHHAAWLFFRRSAGRRLLPGGPIHRRALDLPARAWPSPARTPALLSAPPSPRGWVVLPAASEAATVSGDAAAPALPGLAAALLRAGLGTLELGGVAEPLDREARAERLIEAAR